jgi:peptide/nickel transport system ATP-binding protein
MTDILLRIENIRKVFWSKLKKVNALEDISFNLREGECTALIGESGCGKTTLAKIILGLITPDGGTISVSKGADNKSNLRLGVVFQNPWESMNPRARIWKSIAEPLTIRKKIPENKFKTEVFEIARQVGLSHDLLQRFPYELSGGQVQRAVIARAIIDKPKLLILDEPTSALDISTQSQIINLLVNLQTSLSLTCLFITHDISLVQYIAHNVVIMKDGICIEKGHASDLFSSPKHDYTRALLNTT